VCLRLAHGIAEVPLTTGHDDASQDHPDAEIAARGGKRLDLLRMHQLGSRAMILRTVSVRASRSVRAQAVGHECGQSCAGI